MGLCIYIFQNKPILNAKIHFWNIILSCNESYNILSHYVISMYYFKLICKISWTITIWENQAGKNENFNIESHKSQILMSGWCKLFTAQHLVYKCHGNGK